MHGTLESFSAQSVKNSGLAPQRMLEGVVVSGSWDAAEGVCQVLVGDSVPYEAPFFSDGNQPFMPICTLVCPAIGVQYAPVGGERALIWESQGSWVCWLEHGPDDTSAVPAGEFWAQHRSALNPNAVSYDASVKLTNDGPTTGDKLGGTYTGGTGALTQSQTASGARHTIDDTAQTIETATPPTTGNPDGLLGKFDNVAQQIIHSASGLLDTSTGVKTIVDGAGMAISHIVPTSGGIVALGQIASAISSSGYGAVNKNILTTLGTNINSANLQTLINLGHAMVTAGIPNASSLIPLIVASLIQNVSIPNGSPIVRIADGT